MVLVPLLVLATACSSEPVAPPRPSMIEFRPLQPATPVATPRPPDPAGPSHVTVAVLAPPVPSPAPAAAPAPPAAAAPAVPPPAPPRPRPARPRAARPTVPPQAAPPPALTAPPVLSAAAIRQSLAAARSDFLACYQAALQSDPALAGTVRIELRIEPDGSVGSVEAAGAQSVAPCVESRVRRMRFPAGTGAVTVAYPIVFAPPV
jgi:hypothetical protein